eukprot:296309_1
MVTLCLLLVLPLFIFAINGQDYFLDERTNCNNVNSAVHTPNNSTQYVEYLGTFDNTNACIQACLSKSTATNKCQSYTYHTAQFNDAKYQKHCYGRFGEPYGLVWIPVAQNNINCGRVIYPCKSDMDCELNGKCDSVTKNCTCNAGWTGYHCQQLNLQKATKGTGYHITNDNNSGKPTSSWGGGVLVDQKDTNNDTKYHMFLAEFDNHCGVNSWTINSVVTHARSTKGYNSAYQRVDVIHQHFATEPDAIYGPNGEFVIYYATYDYGNFSECHCVDGSTNKTCKIPNPALFVEYMEYSINGPGGPWSEPIVIFSNRSGTILKQTDDTNLAGIILKNHTFIGMFRVGHWNTDGSEVHLVVSNDWKNSDKYVIDDTILFPQLVPIATEDPFLYRDCDGGYHAIFHNMSPTRIVHPGGHAFSVDGLNWIYAGYIYTNKVEYTDGSTFTFSRRERPHFIFADDVCSPIALTTGVQYGGKYGDATFTLIQPINDLH